VANWRGDQHRYLVHFSDGGAGMRYFDTPPRSSTAASSYLVVRVEQPRAWAGRACVGGKGHGRMSDYRRRS
jgi:hypothetical protein